MDNKSLAILVTVALFGALAVGIVTYVHSPDAGKGILMPYVFSDAGTNNKYSSN